MNWFQWFSLHTDVVVQDLFLPLRLFLEYPLKEAESSVSHHLQRGGVYCLNFFSFTESLPHGFLAEVLIQSLDALRFSEYWKWAWTNGVCLFVFLPPVYRKIHSYCPRANQKSLDGTNWLRPFVYVITKSYKLGKSGDTGIISHTSGREEVLSVYQRSTVCFPDNASSPLTLETDSVNYSFKSWRSGSVDKTELICLCTCQQ